MLADVTNKLLSFLKAERAYVFREALDREETSSAFPERGNMRRRRLHNQRAGSQGEKFKAAQSARKLPTARLHILGA